MLFTPAFFEDPYPAYRALREAGPLHYSTEFFDGAWVLTGHADVTAALRDPRLSARRTGGWVNHIDDDAAQALSPFQHLFARALLFLDAPDHTRLRQALMPAFRPGALGALQATIQAEVDALLDAIDPHQPWDAMAQLAVPLPARVMACWLGVPAAQEADFMRWSDDIAAFIGHQQPTLALGQRAQRGTLAMVAMFRRLLEQRRAHGPATDGSGGLLELMLQAQSDGAIVSEDELLAQCAMMLFAGHETTRHVLGNGLHALLSTPGAWATLQQSPELMSAAVRELLRYDSPVQYTGRRVAETFTLHGQTLQRGDLLITLLGAANRDPSVYTEPDTLRLDRREAMHVSFGSGPHVCIGAALTTLEAEVALTSVLARWPQLALAPTAPKRVHNAVYRGFEQLPLVVRV
jgi:cytochrome P450